MYTSENYGLIQYYLAWSGRNPMNILVSVKYQNVFESNCALWLSMNFCFISYLWFPEMCFPCSLSWMNSIGSSPFSSIDFKRSSKYSQFSTPIITSWWGSDFTLIKTWHGETSDSWGRFWNLDCAIVFNVSIIFIKTI